MDTVDILATGAAALAAAAGSRAPTVGVFEAAVPAAVAEVAVDLATEVCFLRAADGAGGAEAKGATPEPDTALDALAVSIGAFAVAPSSGTDALAVVL